MSLFSSCVYSLNIGNLIGEGVRGGSMMTMVGTTRRVLLLSVSFVSCTSVDGLFSRCLHQFCFLPTKLWALNMQSIGNLNINFKVTFFHFFFHF